MVHDVDRHCRLAEIDEHRRCCRLDTSGKAKARANAPPRSQSNEQASNRGFTTQNQAGECQQQHRYQEQVGQKPQVRPSQKFHMLQIAGKEIEKINVQLIDQPKTMESYVVPMAELDVFDDGSK